MDTIKEKVKKGFMGLLSALRRHALHRREQWRGLSKGKKAGAIAFCLVVLLAIVAPFVMKAYYRSLYRFWPNDKQLPIPGGCTAYFVEEQDDSKQVESDIVSYDQLFMFRLERKGLQNYSNRDMGWKKAYPLICRVQVTNVRYLNMFPGETDKLSYQNQDRTHDVIVEMKIEEILFRGSHPVREGDTITYYGLEQGRIEYHDEEGLDPNNYDDRQTILESRPRFVVGNRYYVQVYSTSFFMKGKDPFSTTVRSVAGYMSGSGLGFFPYITDMYKTGLRYVGKIGLDDATVTPEDFERTKKVRQKEIDWLRWKYEQAR